jgi:DNA repair ATPase RecN
MAEEVKAFSILIEPMYVGNKKDNRLETCFVARIYNPENKTYSEINGAVKPKSRLGQEVKKLIELSKQLKA